LDDFGALGVQVVGASVDRPDANRRFAEKRGLRMPLISDVDYTVAAAFGVSRPMVGVAKRTTFLIEPDGRLAKVYRKVKAKGHAATVLQECKEIWAPD
jgi:peroxiredoxin Q/BCP